MQIALLQTQLHGFDCAASVSGMLQSLQFVKSVDVCLFPANALCCLETEAYPFKKELDQSLSDALAALAKGACKGQTLVLTMPRLNQGKFEICVLTVLNDTWKFSACITQETVAGRLYLSTVRIHEDRFGVCVCQNLQALQNLDLAFFRERRCQGVFFLCSLPWVLGAHAQTERCLSQYAQKLQKNCYLVNAVGIKDTSLFAGLSLVATPTEITVRLPAFEPRIGLFDTAQANPSLAESASGLAELWQGLVYGTCAFVQRSGFKTVVLGLSGGMDSAMVAAIACEALGPENVQALIMPSPYNPESSIQDAKNLADNLGLAYAVLPIEKAMQTFALLLEPELGGAKAGKGDVTYENIQARIRAVLLQAVANRRHAMVLNTSNLSEIAQGYSTLYGDSIGGLAVIGDLLKTEIYALANWYNETHADKPIPTTILTKAPSAELRVGQKDSDTLPDYPILDPMLSKFMDGLEPVSAEEEKVRNRLLGSEFKRRQLPPGLKVRDRSFVHDLSIPLFEAINSKSSMCLG